MTAPTLTRSVLTAGVWEGVIEGDPSGEPAVEVCLGDRVLPGLKVVKTAPGTWSLSLPIPADCISDGVRTLVIRDLTDRLPIGHFTLIAGASADEDLRAEIALLRAEMDMLKQAFRRYCLTSAP